ncbi:MAG: hypothetical protein JWP89_4153 [Schlesneria sp.]|nr:hypothetical protein [Schlesneria sp.]
MAFLAVRKVRYDGKKYEYESPVLGDGINILEGENGTGKSTFAGLVYFGLGGYVEPFDDSKADLHREITGDSGNYVQLSVTIDSSSYVLKRFVGTNDIAVSGEDISAVMPIVRRDSAQRIFSDWILEKLKIDPVTLQFGVYSGKLNITDFLRLIYHNQAPDPSGIFKAIDNNSFVTDSRVFREAVFELLVGKSYQQYYTALSNFRDADRQRASFAKSLELFKGMAADLNSGEEDLNLVFLDQKVVEFKQQQDRLIAFRRELARTPPRIVVGVNLAEWQKELLANELEIISASRAEANLLEEVSRFSQLKADIVSEATQLKKMMFAHEELKLFSANTCPYCLKEVKRFPNRCVCGNDVVEGEYEKFFYDSSEYLAILKSRQKNVETVEIAIASLTRDLLSVRKKKGALEEGAQRLEKQIAQAVDESDSMVDIQQFEAVEERLAVLRQDLAKLEQQRELEVRREALEAELRSATSNVETLKILADQLGTAAQADMQAKRVAFSSIYDRMMRATLKDCRSASIRDDYMPVINGGEYTEASAAVPRRLLYYAALLEMSLTDETVKFPRFLLIDTPETSGIDPTNLKAAVSRLLEVVETGEKLGKRCQVILTTGIGKYPDGMAKSVFRVMHKPADRLLSLKPEAKS